MDADGVTCMGRGGPVVYSMQVPRQRQRRTVCIGCGRTGTGILWRISMVSPPRSMCSAASWKSFLVMRAVGCLLCARHMRAHCLVRVRWCVPLGSASLASGAACGLRVVLSLSGLMSRVGV